MVMDTDEQPETQEKQDSPALELLQGEKVEQVPEGPAAPITKPKGPKGLDFEKYLPLLLIGCVLLITAGYLWSAYKIGKLDVEVPNG